MSEIKVNKISPRTACGTVTLGDSGDTIAIGAGVTTSGMGRTGTVDWDTSSIKTATFSAVNGNGYFANTSGGAFTMNLPAGVAGNIVSVVDYTNTFQTYSLTVSPNGSEKIGGVAGDVVLSTEGQSVTFVYVDGTEGWKNVQDSTSNAIGNPYIIATGGTISTCGNYKIHTFTGPGTFTVCTAAVSAPDNNVEYVVVAGGGSGPAKGPGDAGGGGGAGGFRFASPTLAPLTFPGKPLNAPAGLPVSASPGSYPITVGGGGAGQPDPGGPEGPNCNGANGNPSTFSTITSTGGGRGGYNSCRSSATGFAGGSGGGAGSGIGPGPATAGGAGNTPPVSPAQGTAGGPYQYASPNRQGGGGGGAICSGGTGSPSAAKDGGDGAGLPTGFGANGESCGSYRYYAGGGAGGSGSPSAASGGKGGGGDGGDPGGSGTANTGGGGGGGSGFPGAAGGGSGGSGIVIIRYRYQ